MTSASTTTSTFVASDATISRLMKSLARDIEVVETALSTARTTVRQRVRALAGRYAPTAGISAARPLIN